MGIWNKIFARSKDEPQSIPTGRHTMVGNGYITTLSPYNSRTANVLDTLRGIRDEANAIEFLKKVNPDVSMAVWNFVRLANQGNEMHFYSTGKSKSRIVYLEDKWREFAARINEISNSGLDGLIDQLHLSSFMLGGMAAEAEVTDDRTDIYDVYAVKPQTINWEIGDVNGHKKWKPFQWQIGKKVYLDPQNANFFWIPTDPDIGNPCGTLILSPVLQAIDFQMQILQDMQAVLHHQGYPRNDIEIDLDKILTIVPSHIKNNPEKLRQYLEDEWAWIEKLFQNLNPDDDYIHFNNVRVNMNSGANAARSLDVRAVNELLDVQTLSGTKQMAVFMNRNQGVTESWGTVQFRIFCSGIASCQRGSKRLIEEIARLWCRVNGVQAIPVFKHNTIDWNSEEQRTEVNLLKQKFYAIAVLMGWIDNDTAAREIMGVENATGEPPLDTARLSFGSISNDIVNNTTKQPKIEQDDMTKKVIDLFRRDKNERSN